MNSIIESYRIGEFLVIDSDLEEGVEIAPSIKLIAADGTVFELDDYVIERWKKCFTDKASPSIGTKVDIPEKFLQPGVQLEL